MIAKGFAMEIKPIAKLLGVKTQAKIHVPAAGIIMVAVLEKANPLRGGGAKPRASLERR